MRKSNSLPVAAHGLNPPSKPPLNQPTKGFIRLPQVLERFPVSRSTWWSGVKSGKYPAGIKLGENTTAWRVEDIDTLIAQVSKGGVQ